MEAEQILVLKQLVSLSGLHLRTVVEKFGALIPSQGMSKSSVGP